MKEEEIIKKYQESADEMIRSIKEDNLSQEDKIEWYGYIRGVRDCAFDCGILSKTSIQEILEEAGRIVYNLTLPSKHIN